MNKIEFTRFADSLIFGIFSFILALSIILSYTSTGNQQEVGQL